MSDQIKVNRVITNRDQVMRPDVPSATGAMAPTEEPSGKSKLPWLVLAVVVVVLVLGAVLFRDRLFPGGTDGEVQGMTVGSASEYQAVFLTNGQVYFGKVSNPTAEYVTLRDIFYLQVTQPPLQGSGQTEQQNNISLVKLGSELHGPVDEMHINRSQVLFYEDLKEEGQVVKAIRDYKKNPSNQ